MPLERFDRAMRTASPTAGVPLRTVLERAAELLAERPPLSAAQREALPGYAEWTSCAETLSRLAPDIAHIRPDGVLARHPLHLLAPAVIRLERPGEHAAIRLDDAREALVALIGALEESGGLAPGELTLDDALALVDWAAHVEWLSERDLLGLLDERSQARQRFELSRREVAAAQRALATARQGTGHWTRKLSPGEVTDALAQATALEGRWSSVLRPSFWRLGRLLRSRYRFSRHATAPRWSEVLTALADEYAAADALAEAERAARVRLSVEEPLHEIAERLEVARAAVERLPRSHRPLHEAAVRTGARGEAIAVLAEAAVPARRLRDGLGEVLIDFAALGLDALEESLSEAKEALADLPGALGALELVARLPPRLATAIRTLPLTLREIEAAVAGHCVDQILGSDPALHQFDATTRERHLQQIEKLSRTWQEANAGAVLERAREIFLEHLRLSSLPPSQLTPEQKEFEGHLPARPPRPGARVRQGRCGTSRSAISWPGTRARWSFDLKPVWLMSPLSVSDTLPLRPDAFDVVIFDEASQITLEEAVPSIFRRRRPSWSATRCSCRRPTSSPPGPPTTRRTGTRSCSRGRATVRVRPLQPTASSTTRPRTCRRACWAGTTAAGPSR